MTTLLDKFADYRNKLQTEVDQARARGDRLNTRAITLQRDYEQLIKKTDEENRLEMWNSEPCPRYKEDPLYKRLCLVQHYVRCEDKTKNGKRDPKKEIVLEVVDRFLFKLINRIRERKLDRVTYSQLSNFSDFQIRDGYLRVAEGILAKQLDKQKGFLGFFKDYGRARLDSNIEAETTFDDIERWRLAEK